MHGLQGRIRRCRPVDIDDRGSARTIQAGAEVPRATRPWARLPDYHIGIAGRRRTSASSWTARTVGRNGGTLATSRTAPARTGSGQDMPGPSITKVWNSPSSAHPRREPRQERRIVECTAERCVEQGGVDHDEHCPDAALDDLARERSPCLAPEREYGIDAGPGADRFDPVAMGLQVDVAEDDVLVSLVDQGTQRLCEELRVPAGGDAHRHRASAQTPDLRGDEFGSERMRFARPVQLAHRDASGDVQPHGARAQPGEVAVLARTPADRALIHGVRSWVAERTRSVPARCAAPQPRYRHRDRRCA